jgi:prepilin-type N-terminal cleavage/methylation domain-containing protein
MNRSSSNKGFTLVEIMIVVVIIGLLAAMAVPAFQRVRQNSRKASIENLVRQIAGAADQYMLENGATSLTYGALTAESGNTNDYLKGNPAVDLAQRLNFTIAWGSIGAGANSVNSGGATFKPGEYANTNFTIAQGQAFTISYPGSSITGVW